MNLSAGTALQQGKYVINSSLAQSALGLTFRATQARSHQPVVLQTLQVQPQADSAHLKRRFIEEAQRLAQCQHPGLVRVMDIFEEGGLPFAVMDDVAGQPLTERVRSRGALPETEAVQYMRQVGSALSVLHRQGLLHRDIAPEHLIRPKGAPFVVLVGLNLTHGAVLGVPDSAEEASPYAAPEQHQRQVNLTPATDLYGLAATLYFLVTGQEPIASPRLTQTSLRSPRQLQPQLSTEIEQAILSGMALNAQERPQTVAGWLALLPNGHSVPGEQGSPHATEHPRSAIKLPNPTALPNGASPPTAPPAPANPTIPVALTTHTTAPPTRPPMVLPVATAKSRLPKALLLTAAIAIAGGAGLGLALRLSAAHGIGPTFFQTQQDFPPVKNWPLQASPAALSTAPPPPEPLPLRSFAPEPLPRVKFSPSASPTPLTPEPSPSATIEPSPEPTPSSTIPSAQPSPPLNLAPSPALSPRPIPSVQAPADTQGLQRLWP
ncbi:MAG: protein kinase [Lyngbya sp. HA4199-MV5]|jgi:serine/threonine-protein kinase|nr:protein kinase [Lyngbya sp. HA4199-MV5]